MAVWKNAKMAILFYSKDAATEHEACSVTIDDHEVVIEYLADDETVQYRGRNDGSGHFDLRAPEVEGKASLHMFPGSRFLEGHWIEGGDRGMWRIDLGKPLKTEEGSD